MEHLEPDCQIIHFLKDDKIILKKPSLDESLDGYLSLVNDVDNLVWMEGVGNYPLNREDLKEYISTNTNLFLFIYTHNQEHVGNIQLSLIDLQNRNAQLGLIVGANYQGNGYATCACRLLVRHAFEILNLHRLYLTVISGNDAGVRLYEKLGFVKEGIEKDMHLHGFRYYDGIRYRMLENEYREIVNAENPIR